MTNAANLWPDDAAQLACIKTEAENPHEAVLLAAHQPMRFKTPDGAGAEEDLLEAFLSPTVHDRGTLLMTVVGNTGSGKSHALMWLNARLRQIADGRRRVIRVPKQTSLRRFVGLVIDAVEDIDPEIFQGYRKKLDEASDPPDSTNAALELRAKLQAELLERSRTARQSIEAAQEEGRRPSYQDRKVMAHASREGLYGLLATPALDKVLVTGDGALLQRIAARAFEGSFDVDAIYRFEPPDFELDSAFLGQVDRTVRKYATQLQQERHRRDAAEVLNGALDGALAQLVGMSRYNLGDLFREVRTRLLESGMELCVLIEDFAQLAGVQREVLGIAIEEGIKGGKQELCDIRTIMAVTPGTEAELIDTVRDRQVLWRIAEERGGMEAVLDEAVELTAHYLNAARVGEPGLIAAMEAVADPGASREWVPKIGVTGEVAGLEGFDDDPTGLNLFPFNRYAIRELTMARCGIDPEHPRLIPRQVMRHVISYVLKQRDVFVAGGFPDATLMADLTSPKVDVQEYLERLGSPDVERYRCLARLWSGDPATPAEFASRIDATCFSAFGLQPLDAGDLGLEISGPKPGTDRVTAPPPAPSPKPASIPGEREIQEWEALLDKWRDGTQFPQGKANWIRGQLAKALDDSIGWEWEGLNPDRFNHKRIYLPNAAGNQPNPLLEICSDSAWGDDNTAVSIQLAVRALCRYHFRKTWSYPGGGEDAARLAAFTDDMGARYLKRKRTRYLQDVKCDTRPLLAQGLLLGAAVLGMSNEDDARSADSLFAEALPDESLRSNEFGELQRRINQHRPKMREWLLDQIGARKDRNRKILAVNWGLVDAAVAALRKSGRLRQADEGLLANRATAPVFGGLQAVSGDLDDVVASESKRYLSLAVELKGWYADAPADALRARVEAWAQQAKDHGVPLADQEEALLQMLKGLGEVDIQALIQRLAACAASGSRLERTSRVAAVQDKDASFLLQLSSDWSDAFEKSEAHLLNELEIRGGPNTEPDEALNAARHLVETLGGLEAALR